MSEIEHQAETDLLTAAQDAQQHRLVPSGRAGAMLDPLTGLTHEPGVVKGSRARLKAIIQEQVEREATSGRMKWPSRAARRAWVRDETRRRYSSLTNPANSATAAS